MLSNTSTCPRHWSRYLQMQKKRKRFKTILQNAAFRDSGGKISRFFLSSLKHSSFHGDRHFNLQIKNMPSSCYLVRFVAWFPTRVADPLMDMKVRRERGRYYSCRVPKGCNYSSFVSTLMARSNCRSCIYGRLVVWNYKRVRFTWWKHHAAQTYLFISTGKDLILMLTVSLEKRKAAAEQWAAWIKNMRKSKLLIIFTTYLDGANMFTCILK